MSIQKSLATHGAIHSLISRRTGAPVPKLLGERGWCGVCCLLATDVSDGAESFFGESKTGVRGEMPDCQFIDQTTSSSPDSSQDTCCLGTSQARQRSLASAGSSADREGDI